MGLFGQVRDAVTALARRPQMAEVVDGMPRALAPQSFGRSVFDGLQNMVAGLGTTRDKRYYSEYGWVYRFNQQQLDAMYEGSWLFGKIVDIPAGDMTREWVRLNWDDYDKDPDGAKAIESAENRLDFRCKIKDAITWGRLYGGAVVVVGIRGDQMHEPLEVEKIKQGSLQNLFVLDRWEISTEQEIDTDMGSPNFGLPLFYRINESHTRVHWTRVVRFGGRRLPRAAWIQNSRWDGSVLQHVADSVKNYDASRDNAASMMYEANVDIIRTEGFFESMGQGGEAKATARFQAAGLMKAVNRMLLLDKREEYQQKTVTFAGVTDIIGDFRLDACGAADIPITRLFGQSPAGLTATGEHDMANYYAKIKADQEGNLRSPLEWIYEILVRSELGNMPENFSLSFNPLWQPSDKEKADTEKVRAETDKVRIDSKVLSAGAVARELFDRKVYRTMEDEDVAMALEESETDPVDPFEIEDPDEDENDEDADLVPPDPDELQAARKAKLAADSHPGDMIRHEKDGWHAFAGDRHVGGPYKRHALALRRLRKFDRSYRR